MQTVGELLRAERLKKGLSIKDVESAINIRALYLNAIEEGNCGIIPGEVYARGFIRNYATFLGLDPQQVMDLYRQNQGQTNENDSNVSQPEAILAKPPSENGGGFAKWLIVVLVAAGVVAGLTWWSSASENQSPATPTPPPQQQPQQLAAPQSIPPTQAIEPAKPTNKVTVTAKYNALCWTQIFVDGKEIYEGTPKSGDSLTWEAANKLSAKFGNAGAVDLVYNGNPVGKIGGNGEVTVKTFTLTGITQ